MKASKLKLQTKDDLMLTPVVRAAALGISLFVLSPTVHADGKAAAIDEMEAYLEFVDYGGGVIFAEQIPKEDWPKMMLIDARDAAQFAKGHIPGAVNIDWRQVLAKRNTSSRRWPSRPAGRACSWRRASSRRWIAT